MATKKERHPSSLTLARSAAVEESPIYGHFWPADSGNSPGSLPAGLPARLPYQLPEPAKIARGRKPASAPRAFARRMPEAARPAQPGALVCEPGGFLFPPGSASGPPATGLGRPLDIRQVAHLIGCSPWTVRQTLIPRGLPHFRFKASGRLTFFTGQVVRWIESQQQGGLTTK
jgi:hypothetical protein